MDLFLQLSATKFLVSFSYGQTHNDFPQGCRRLAVSHIQASTLGNTRQPMTGEDDDLMNDSHPLSPLDATAIISARLKRASIQGLNSNTDPSVIGCYCYSYEYFATCSPARAHEFGTSCMAAWLHGCIA